MPGSILENIHDPPLRAPPAHLEGAPGLQPRLDMLKDGQTPVTLYPITGGPSSIPSGLVEFLHVEFSVEIERGCTYPMEEPMTLERFRDYWFGTFAVVALKGDAERIEEGRDWESECLGSFYIKPNYPGLCKLLFLFRPRPAWHVTYEDYLGRCSHVCNAGFLTATAARGQGTGMIMGKAYLDYAPKLVKTIHKKTPPLHLRRAT